MQNVWVLASLWVGLSRCFFAKAISKMVGLFPSVKAFHYHHDEAVYFTLMMSTGLTFGTISALFALNHGIIDQAQYSYLVATVIGSAVIPTMIANAWFMPRHLLLESRAQGSAVSRAATPGAEGELPWSVEPDDAV
jgi:glutathione-regulated potassium-efflux system ancillary protein KefC